MICRHYQDCRPYVLAGIALAAVVGVIAYGVWPQRSDYHAFADQRCYLGIPHFFDILSNVPFFLVGIAGLIALRSQTPGGALPALRSAYFAFFLGALLLCPGSAYYHLNPTNSTLAWDRLPMTMVFMSFFSIIVGEHISPRRNVGLLVMLLLLGVSSVLFWRISDSGTGGDLRFYILVHFLPLILNFLIVVLYPSSLIPTFYVWAALCSYLVAMIFERQDVYVFQLTGFVSGHTLKHLCAALGIFFFLAGLLRRRPAHPVSKDLRTAGNA